jgi:hypothetical protein
VAAQLSGRRVEASARTETSTTWANKDGSLTTEPTAGSTRFRDEATGKWRNVDLNLVQKLDETVEPKAHPEALRLTGGSGAPAKSWKAARAAKATSLVTLGEGTQQIALRWKGGLPRPKLDGTIARHASKLLAAAGLHGHKYALDALVAATALASPAARGLHDHVRAGNRVDVLRTLAFSGRVYE